MKSFKTFKKEALSDPVIEKYYDELGLEFNLIARLIDHRLRHGLTQADLAKKIGTKQSAISRFESGAYNPTITFLYKVADALDAKIQITVR